jgi:hypothetical protein
LGYILIFAILLGVWVGFKDRIKYNLLKRRGVKVAGIIISNSDGGGSERFRLGGNINHPTVKFVTKEGQAIIGSPVLGFITQYEVITPLRVIVFYDVKQPGRFCIELPRKSL